MGRQPLVMQQARQAFDRRFLVPQAAGQLRLVTALFLNDRAPKGGDPFELMPRCPRQYVRAILREASSPRVLVCHNPRLARVRTRGYSPPNECVLTSALDQQPLRELGTDTKRSAHSTPQPWVWYFP